MNGYILISRSLVESSIWDKPPLYIKLWVWLLCRAQYSDYKSLKRGQLWTTYGEMREAMSWYVGARKVTPSKDEIYRILNFLASPENASNATPNTTPNATMIEKSKATRGVLITICNYNVYQDPKKYERDELSTGERDTERGSKTIRTTTGQMKNVKNINKDDETFEAKSFLDILSDEDVENLDQRYEKFDELINMIDDQVVDLSIINKPYSYLCRVADNQGWPKKRRLTSWFKTI